MKRTEIDEIGNYYGCLNVAQLDGRFFWMIENYDSDPGRMDDYREIPKSLYDEIIKWHDTRKDGQ